MSPTSQQTSTPGASYTFATFNLPSDTNDLLQYPGTSVARLGTGDFTLVFRLRSTNHAADTMYPRIYTTDGPSGNTNGNLQIILDVNAGSIYVWSTAGDIAIISSVGVCDGEWHWVAVRRLSGLVSVWVDGAETAYTSSTPSNRVYTSDIGNFNGGQPRPLFASYHTGGGSFRGDLASFAVHTSAISDADLQAMS